MFKVFTSQHIFYWFLFYNGAKERCAKTMAGSTLKTETELSYSLLVSIGLGFSFNVLQQSVRTLLSWLSEFSLVIVVNVLYAVFREQYRQLLRSSLRECWKTCVYNINIYPALHRKQHRKLYCVLWCFDASALTITPNRPSMIALVRSPKQILYFFHHPK